MKSSMTEGSRRGMITIVRDSPETRQGQAIPTGGAGQVMTNEEQIIKR